MHSASPFRPVSVHERIPVLDVLRGIASLGILLVNIYGFANTGRLPPEQKMALPTYPVDAVLKPVLDIFVDTKFITLFSILFGVGFALQLEKAKRFGIFFKAYFARRMLVLLLIGCLHAYLLWFGDIIRYYALSGLFLLLVMHWSEKAILHLALFLAIFVTATVFILNSIIGTQYTDYPTQQQIHDAFAYGTYQEAFFVNWRIDPVRNFLQDSVLTVAAVFGRVLLGYWLGRIMFFRQPERFLKMRRTWLFWGLCLGVPCSVAFWMLKAGRLPLDSYWLLWLPYAIACGLVLQSLLYISVVLKLYEKKSWKKRLKPFAYVGRMPLTNYLLQSVLCIALFYGWFPGAHLTGIGATGLFFISLAVFGVQALFSRWWLLRHASGPAEWLWKKLAYPRKAAPAQTASA